MNIQSETQRKLESQKMITSVLEKSNKKKKNTYGRKQRRTKETLDESERGE